MAYGVGREMLMLCNYMYFESRRILQLEPDQTSRGVRRSLKSYFFAT